MCFKIKFTPKPSRPATAILMLCLLLPWVQSHLQSQDETILVDKIAAVVNQEIITLTDIDKAIRFYPVLRGKEQSEDQFYSGVLDELINYKTVCLEYQNNFTLKEEDYVKVQSEAIERVGSLEIFMQLLKSFDMDWQDFKEFVREKVVYEMVMEKHLQINTTVNFKDIEAFYNNEYLPLQKQLNLQPGTLFQMAPQIEKHLSKIEIRKKLSNWLKELRSSYNISIKLGDR